MQPRSSYFAMLGLMAALCLAPPAKAQPTTLQSHRIGDEQYVAVSDLAALYNLGRNLSSSPEHAEYKTATAHIIFQVDSRDVMLNGVRHWLSQPVVATRGRMWIGAVDVLKAIDPVLRQGRQPNPTPVRTIVLDAGHGGADRGTHGATNRYEKEFTLDLAKRLERQLNSGGLRVLLTRTTDDTMTLDERVEFAKARRGDLFVSVHFNSGGTADGIETYCMPPAGSVSTADSKGRRTEAERSPGNRSDEQNVWLAHCVQKSLVRATGATDRGVRRARFYVIRYATCPAILVESGFLTNRTEEQKILSAEYREQLAKAIAEGILNYKKSTENK